MKILKSKLALLILFPLAIFINYLSSLSPQLTENLYSLKINKFTVIFLSRLTNFIPFSLYEITIICSVIAFIIYLITTLINMIKNKTNILKTLLNFFMNCGVVLSIAYFLFIMLWGLNYNRVPIDVTLGIERRKYSKEELSDLYMYLINNANTLRKEIPVDNHNFPTFTGGYKSVLNRASLGYDAISHKYVSLSGNYGTPKPFIFSEFFNYSGITGIYFPYSGQPGVAIKAPTFTIPFTTLHEMAHQRGYSSEDEANFIAFLTAINHPDDDFKYSGYMQAISYTSNALYQEDSQLLNSLNLYISADVKRDIKYKYYFWKRYEGKIGEISTKINDTYLKSNGVSDGEKSYGRVVDLLISYYENYVKQN